MRFGLVLGLVAAGAWVTAAFAQDCCAGSKDRGSYKEESGSSQQHQNYGRALRAAPGGQYSAPAWNAPRYMYQYRYGRPY
jgi:hypothetical protein